ncbi:hypothetical protein AB0H73_14675 [Streptomyces olivoreticuli]
MDDQPWWLIEQLPVVARAYAEVREIQMERSQAAAERDASRR